MYDNIDRCVQKETEGHILPVNIKDLTMEELTEYFIGIGEPKFRAKQCFTWLHKGVTSFGEMSNLSKSLKEKLSESFFISVPEIARKQVSSDGTIKYLYKNFDGTFTESVIMLYHHGVTACISIHNSQFVIAKTAY